MSLELLSGLLRNPVTRFVMGDDVFISYSRTDGSAYATGLATELAARRIACRFDQWGSEPGQRTPRSIINALKQSAVLVLVSTRGAAQSVNVAEEV